jgi:hypothetical protein
VDPATPTQAIAQATYLATDPTNDYEFPRQTIAGVNQSTTFNYADDPAVWSVSYQFHGICDCGIMACQ